MSWKRVIAAGAALGACGGGQPRSAAPGPPRTLEVALVDSIPYEGELYSGFMRRVVVRSSHGADTLPGVHVEGGMRGATAVAGDSVVYGLLSRGDSTPGLFAYDVRTRRTRILASPADWHAHEGVGFAPDGAHFAYLGGDTTDGSVYAAVATLPGGMRVLRGPSVAALPTDAGVGTMQWLDADRFEVTIDLSTARGRAYRARGSLAARRISGDTVPSPWAKHDRTEATE